MGRLVIGGQELADDPQQVQKIILGEAKVAWEARLAIGDAQWKSLVAEVDRITTNERFDLVVGAEAVSRLEHLYSRKVPPAWIVYPSARDPQALVSLIHIDYFRGKDDLLAAAFRGVSGLDAGYAMRLLDDEATDAPIDIRRQVLKNWLNQDSFTASEFVASSNRTRYYRPMTHVVADWLASKGNLETAREWYALADANEQAAGGE